MNVVYFETKQLNHIDELVYILMKIKNNKILFDLKGIRLPLFLWYT